MYDLSPTYSSLTETQRMLLTFVAIKRQRIKTLEIVATCRASIAAANMERGIKLVEAAQKALRMYIAEAENLFKEEEKTQQDLAKVIAEESQKAYLIQPAQGA